MKLQIAVVSTKEKKTFKNTFEQIVHSSSRNQAHWYKFLVVAKAFEMMLTMHYSCLGLQRLTFLTLFPNEN